MNNNPSSDKLNSGNLPESPSKDEAKPEDDGGLSEPNDLQSNAEGEGLHFGKHKNMIELEDTCYMWVIDKLIKYELIKSKDDTVISDQMKKEIHNFLDTQERCLFFVYNDLNGELICRTQLKDIPVTENYNLAFFIKKDIKKKYNENHYVLEELIVNDYIYGNLNKYFLDQMNEKYIPFILNELKWPDGIKKELIANLHKFMINLSQTYFADRKQVVLYIPRENISETEIKDKDLISRLETIMIEWTTQIRDFMFNQETVTNKEDFDVLNEISYWDFRFMNLTNISTQLENSELQRIIDILEKHRGGTDNLKSFVSLKSLILDERKKAKDILKYLKILEEPCEMIKKTEIKDIHNLLIQIMDRIRFISIYCDYFKAKDRISDLIKKVSIQLMHKFIDKIRIYLKSIKEEYSENLHIDLKLIKYCLKDWQKLFDQARERIKLNEPLHVKEIWDFEQKDLQNIFYDLESFEKRCQNLLDICLCQLQFGKNKKNTKLPIFGGTKGFEIYKQLNDIEEKFDDQMKKLFTDDNKVEDIKINKWQEEFRVFSKHIEDLEDMYKNTISSAFKRVKTIEEGVNYVENFYSLAKRQKIKNFMENEIALEVLQMWSKELDKMKIKNDSKNFVRSMRQTIEGGNALWSKFLFLRIEDYKKIISKLNLIFNPKKLKIELEFMKSSKMNEIKQQHLLLEASLKSYLQGENIDLKKEIEYIVSINDQKLEERLGSKLINSYINPNENPFNSLYQCNYPIDLMRLFAINNSLNKLEEYGISNEVVKKINDVEERTRPLKESVINVIREYNNLVLSIKNQNENDIFSDHFNKLYTDNILRVINRYWNSAGNETYLNKFRKKIEEVSKNIQQFKHNTELIYDLCDQISKKSYFFQEKNNDIYEKHEYIEKQRKHQEEISRQIEENCDKILNLLKDSYKDLANIQEPRVHLGFKAYLEEISEKYFTDSVEKALMNSITNMHKAILGFKGINPPAFFRVHINMQVIPRHYLEAAYEFSPTESELGKIINESLHEIIKNAKNAPNVLDRFLKQHQILVEKTDKKIQEDKIKRQQINSNATVAQTKTIEPNSTIERKRINPTQSPNKKPKQNISPNKKGLKEPSPQNFVLDSKKDVAANKNIISVFATDKDKDKSEGPVFPKAREVQLHFEKEYKKKGFDKEFTQKLNIWKGSKAINDYLKTLGEEENRKQLNSYFVQFENFLMNEGADIKDFTLHLTTQLKYPQNFRNDLISIEDNSTIPETIHNHIFIQFDATNTKKKLINMSENILNFILDLIKKKTKEELVDKVELEFNEHEEKFSREPRSKEEYKYLSDEWEKCLKEKNMRFTKISAANRIVTEIILQHAKGGDDLMERVNILEKRKEIYEKKLEEAEKILQKVRKKLAEDVSKEYSEFKSNVEEMKKEFLMSIPDKIEGGMKEEMEETNQAFIKLDFYEDKCEAFRGKEKEIDKGLELFQDDLHIIIEGNKDLLDVEELIKSLKRIWEIKREMNNIVKIWRNTQFYELDLTKMCEDKQIIENKLVNNCKDLKSKQIYTHMKEQLDTFQNIFFVLGLLRDDSMNPDYNPTHWEKLQNKVPDKFHPKDNDFNFERIYDLAIHNFKDLIIEIVDYARAQQKIDIGIKIIKKSWKELRLNLEIKYNTENRPEFAKLTDNLRMTESLDNDLAQIAKYKSTKYYDDFKERIDELENELNKISDVYSQLKQVQEKWSELLNVFNKDKDDMAQQAVIEHDNFKANTKEYLTIFEGFERIKIVKDCFIQEKLDVKLKSLSDSFAQIEKGLNKYLEAKRTTFERLYFLSNHDLLELLGNAFEEKIINFHLSKLFGGIDRVVVEVDPRSKGEKKVKINYVFDNWGEKLKLDDYIEMKHVVEIWMKDLETEMKTTIEKMLSQAKSNKEIFNVKANEDLDVTLEKAKLNGQLLLTITQYQWRRKIEQECFDSSKSSDSGYSTIYESYREVLGNIVKYVNESRDKINISDKNRVILFNYILTIRYLMDTTSSLKEHKVRTPENYDWQKILKFQFIEKKDNQKKVVKANNKIEEFILLTEQLNNTANYGYEYIGNKERLVITPLTEKCYLTMMTAIFYNRGGCLQGPAGTGKTETIKDLARNLGKFVIVFNCSSKNNYNTMATIFLGLLRTGAWCCFDEFNRIEVEVLSVVRIQLTKIFDGLRSNAKNINFKGSYVDVNKNLAVFITMNPSYMFRSELPDNLKTLFRPISVMAAEKMKICEIKFLSEGYQTSNQLAQKLTSSLEVMEQQLSKQNHYDFSLRAIIAILKHVSFLKKKVITTDESAIVKMAITEIIKPKLVAEDEEIFNTIMITIFNQGRLDAVDRLDVKENEADFRKEIKDEIDRKNLTGSPYLVNQIIQLFNYFSFKHGIMLVGETLSGKSTCIKLMEGLSDYLSDKKKDGFQKVHITRIYPKSVEIDDLYGKQDPSQEGIFSEGLLPHHLNELCNMRSEGEKDKQKWLVLDGPVDSNWIETLNTVLDETKMLSLPSGYRINLKPDVKIVFETENLSQATPATVSRVGLVFFEADKLSWFPIARKWLDSKRHDKMWEEYIARWFDKYVYKILDELKSVNINPLINLYENHIILNLISIFECFIDEIKRETSEEEANEEENRYWDFAERLFVFSFVWALGGSLDEQSRIVIDTVIRKHQSNYPPHSTVFDFLVNPEKEDWGTWEEKMIQFWMPSSNTSYNEIFVPTLDIVKNKAIIHNLIKYNKSPFIIGPSSSGKSSIIKSIFKTLDTVKYKCISVNCTYNLSPKFMQEVIEYNFEKRNNRLYPPSNKKALCFVDDLNLPKKDIFNNQTTNEMVRQFFELEGWYDTEKLGFTNIKQMLMIASVGIKGNNRSDISSRLTSKFIPLTIPSPNDATKQKIFHTVLSFYLSSFPNEDIKKLSESLANSMIGLYNSIIEKEQYLPTPTKCHYIFSLRDITKIFEQVSKAKESFYTREYFNKLWVHESFRTFYDRFMINDDKTLFRDLIYKQLETNLGVNYKEVQLKDGRDCIFVDFINDKIYEEITDFDELRKNILQKVQTNKAYGNMVFFDQAISYICILNRILNKNNGGHGLLIGTGASGRTSYLKIACELSNVNLNYLTSGKEMKLKEWKDYIKMTLRNIGKNSLKSALLFKEKDIFSIDVIEDINHLIINGHIPNLMNEEFESIKNDPNSTELIGINLEKFIENFNKNCLENLHLFLNISPLGEKLREYCRIYPSLVSHSTLVYFADWPQVALLEVAKHFLGSKIGIQDEEEGKENLSFDIADILSQIHTSVLSILPKYEIETKRKSYFTSSNFIELIKTFNKYLNLKQNTIISNIAKYKLGLHKISIGKEKIAIMTVSLEEKDKEEVNKRKELEKIMDKINNEKKICTDKEHDLELEREKHEKHRIFFEKHMQESMKELAEAQKPMEEARLIAEKNLSRDKLLEYKNMNTAGPDIVNVFSALMAMFNKSTKWADARSYLQHLTVEKLVKVEELPVTPETLPNIQKYSQTFNFEKLETINVTIPFLAKYIVAVEKYFKAKWNSDVKKRNLDEARKSLDHASSELQILENKLNEIKENILKLELDKNSIEENLRLINIETNLVKQKLERANLLIEHFKSEEGRWSEQLEKNQDLLKNVLGNSILAAAILTYFGIFTAKFREDIYKVHWLNILKSKKIDFSYNFDFLDFVSNPREIQDWVISELPNDRTFKENAVIIKYSLSFPLIIDPQDQAYTWIKNMVKNNEDKNYTKVYKYTPQSNNYINLVKNNLEAYHTVLINNIGETLGMDLDEAIKGFNKDKHKLYLMTKLPNPRFLPEVSARTNIVNFLVNEKGLEEQLLSLVVKEEKSETEAQIRTSIDSIFKSSKTLDLSEEMILQSLNQAHDNYLDDEKLINDLKRMKDESNKMTDDLKQVNLNMEKIITSREEYRPLAKKVSKMYFVLYGMNSISNMYEFSLASYKNLFKKSIIQSRTMGMSENSDDRIKSIEKLHIEKLLQYSNQCLFERDRIIFSLQLCLAVIISNEEDLRKELEIKSKMMRRGADDETDEKDIKNQDFFNMEEFKYLIAPVPDTFDSKGMLKPSWISDEESWRYLNYLETKIPDFKGINGTFSHNNADWYKWFISKDIETEALPVEWETKCRGRKNIRRLLFIKALRPDKFSSALKKFINENLDLKEIKETTRSLKEILEQDVTCRVPLLIVHSSGIDPSESLQRLWDSLEDKRDEKKDNRENSNDRRDDRKEEKAGSNKDDKKERRFSITTLNHDQIGNTLNELSELVKVGGWMFIANTHFTLQSIPNLEKKLEDLNDIHPDFRLIVSTNPHLKYPISFLQKCEKITFEAPKGVAINMARIFDDLIKENPKLEGDREKEKNTVFSKMIFSLCIFHSLLNERRKFKSYGWSSSYEFNNSDFKICFDIIRNYMQKFVGINDFPWKAVQELIAINYGSRFTNDYDLLILKTYAKQFFSPKIIQDKNYNFSSSETPYCLPDDALYERAKQSLSSDSSLYKTEFSLRMAFYRDEVKRSLPKEDAPEIFGLHFNAEISAEKQENLLIIENIRALSTEIYDSEFNSYELSVTNKINNSLKKLPKIIPIEKAKKTAGFLDKKQPDPLIYVLIQECVRYNNLISLITEDLKTIESALKGNTLLNPVIEKQISQIYEDKVPLTWILYYPSTKPLAMFLNDLNLRVEFFNKWLNLSLTSTTVPYYVLSYFINPHGFISAIKQKYCMRHETGIPFSKVEIEYKITNEEDEAKVQTKQGYLIKGILIEGGYWDKKVGAIRDENIQDLFCTLPIIIMTPKGISDNDLLSSVQNQQVQNIGINANINLTHSFPLYYIPVRGEFLGKSTYIMDIKLTLFKDKDRELEENRIDKSHPDYWIKKGTCLLLSKND